MVNISRRKRTGLTLVLTLVSTLALAACGGSTESASEPDEPEMPSATSVPESTATAITTATPTPEPTATAILTATPTPEPTLTPEPTPTSAPTATPTPTPTPTPEPTPTPAATAGDADDPATQDPAVDPVGAGGAELFASTCAFCHGAGGAGTARAPTLAGIGQFFVADATPLITLVTSGGTNMPEFGSKLSAPEIAAVVEFVVGTFQ